MNLHSLLYKNLAESGDTVQVSATHPCRELACEFQIIALASPDMSANLAEIETKVNQTLLEFERRGVYEEDLLRAKASVEAAAVFSLQSVAGKVAVLAANETFHGNPDLVAEDLNRYLSVTKEDVMRVFTQYIKNKSSVVLSVVPQGEVELAAKEQNYVLPDRSFGIVAEQFIPSRSAKSSFDRTQMPPVGPALSVELPTYWQTRLSNGIEVMGITSHETPTVTLSIDFEGGVLLEPLEKAGLANMTAMLMNESTHNYSSAALANELAKLGSEIQISAGGRYVQIEVSSLIHKIDQTMELVEEKLLRPAFRKEEFERVKTRILQAKRQQYSDPAVLASFARNTLLFGQHNRVGLPDDGTIATIGAITLDDIKQFYARFFTSYKAQVAVVGSLDEIKATKLLSFLQDLSDAPYKVPGFKEFPQYEGQSIYIVDNGNTAQSSLLLTARALPFDATGEFFKSQLMNFSLGSAFNSRINLNLREEKGLTYGASANFIGGRNLGWYEVRADVQSDNTALAISEILQEIIMFKREGITQEELMFMRNAYSQYDALNFETPASKAYFLRRMLGFGLRPDYRQKQLAILDNMTEDSINDIAQRRLEPNALQIIVVGNKKKLASQLRALGLPIQSLELPD